MNPNCKACKKPVYNMELISCLDAAWHKGCFTCQVCNLTLTMKTFKGYNKMPYCNAHYPTTRFTAIADTPEAMRVKKNTQQTSEYVYRKDYVQSIGHYQAVADDVESQRHKANAEKFSNVKYHNDYERSRGSKISVSDDVLTVHHTKTQHYASKTGYKSTGGSDASGNVEPPEPFRNEPQPPAEPPLQVDANGVRYRAIYDYNGGDEDKVCFRAGDIIVNLKHVASDWKIGSVQRTGQRGLLPVNFIEQLS